MAPASTWDSASFEQCQLRADLEAIRLLGTVSVDNVLPSPRAEPRTTLVIFAPFVA
jgi:hypothetical protein